MTGASKLLDPDAPGAPRTLAGFLQDLQKHHLAQIIAAKYEKDPKLLGFHYGLNFIPLPPFETHGDDPARNSVVILVSYRPEFKIPNFGNWLIPENIKGEYYYGLFLVITKS